MINRYASLRQGLVGCWVPSLGASGFRLIDRSGYGNHGVLTNMDPGTDWAPSGGKLALDFDGSNDEVRLSRVFYTMPFSVSAWAMTRNNSLPQTILGIGNSQNTAPLFQVAFRPDLPNSPIICNMRDINGNNTWSAFNGFSINTWYHITAVFYSTSDRLVFVNSVPGIRDTTSYLVDSLDQMSIGSMPRITSGAFLNGSVDDIRLYNRALTPSEIRLLYTGGRGVGLQPERIKHRRKTSAAATNRRRRIIIGASQ
jgi:hypothetical protein